VRFGEFLRVDCQLALERLGDRSLASLIESTRHAAPKIRGWATRRLKVRDKETPGEVVQTEDPVAIADILRAYGYVRDPDVARIVISFARSRDTHVQRGAREAIALFGDVANWPLREMYEEVVGGHAPRAWSWDRVARELFAEFDRQKLARAYEHLDQGLEAKKAGELDKMREHFDLLLAHDPNFEDTQELASGYFAFAQEHTDDLVAAREALLRARRLGSDEALDKRIESLLLTVEGELLLKDGVGDQILFRRAIQLDPENERAKDRLGEIAQEFDPKQLGLARNLGAITIGALGLAGALWLLIRSRFSEAA
jgi:tetratricopeptide (TPR) repeat protein